ncbi:VPS9 domain-containing protein 1-like [Actinia tenebrosa]|uniref:VPS9 domain-containing protein 1-like n=1 Tax=Actinia tenebrosa TaxID=6105 RepID=A0A6P8HIQ6_ACTTE|nr:VPS9 domain-containing protein 1-like [Actinia tenebrosa]
MAEGVSASMSIVLRMVGDAIGLDSQNRSKEAYCQYLSCCIYISQILKDNAWDKDLRTVYNKDVAKLFKLIQQCQERALNIISSESPSPLNSPPGSPWFPNTQLYQTLTPPTGNVHKHSHSLPPRPGIGYTRTPSDPSNPGLSTTPPQYRGKPLKLPSPPSSPRVSSVQSLSNLSRPPTDRRITGLNLRFSRDAVDKNLSTMRKMSENMLVAKAREEAIRKKVWERQQRLQIEANRRFASNVAVSKEQQEQRLLYTKILEYEQDVVWPQQLREQLKHSPEDTALINNIINKIFSSKDHPLKQFLLQYQYQIYMKLLPLLKDVEFPNEKQVKDTNNGLDSSQTLSKSGSEQVDSGSTKHCASNDLEDRNISIPESNDGINSKDPVDQEDFESDGSNAEFSKAEDNNMENNKKIIDTDPSSATSNTNAENIISNNCTNDREIVESNKDQELDKTMQNDLSNMDSDINELRSSNSDESQKKVDLKDDIGESRDCVNSANPCTENKYLEGIVSSDESITSIISCILENIITQIVEDEFTGTSENQSKYYTERNTKHLELKPVDDNDSGVDGISKDSFVDSTNKSCVAKKTDLMKMESFDLESEFLSLEDEMFESESSDEEHEEDDEKPDTTECSGDSLNQNSTSTRIPNTEPEASRFGLPSNTEENNEGQAVPEWEEEKEEKPELKDVSENPSNNGGENVGGSDDSKDTSSAVDLEDTRRQLNEIFVDMRFFLEKLKGFIILAYEELATPTGHDQCYAAVEYPFFQPLWPLLLGVLRRVNFDKEMSLGSVMTKRIQSPPADMGVIDRLCLSDKECLEASGNTYPYQLAVEQLHKVSSCCCPLEKVECIVRASRGICQCVEDYWECKGKPKHCPETSIGCDDLLPIFSYVIVRSGMAQLISECIAMEEFIPEGYLMGEEGYCLTTLQTALAYLVTLDCP